MFQHKVSLPYLLTLPVNQLGSCSSIYGFFCLICPLWKFVNVYKEMEEYQVCLSNSLRYDGSAIFLQAKGRFADAHRFYETGILRNAQPIDMLKKAEGFFRYAMSKIVRACETPKAIAKMRVLMTRDSNNAVSSSFLLDDDSRSGSTNFNVTVNW